MSNTDIIASLALLVSAGSLLVSFLSYKKASKHDKPTAWTELHSIGADECWALTIHIRNPTDFDLRADGLNVPIEQVPIDSKRSFMLADYAETFKAANNEVANLPSVLEKATWHIKMTFPADTPIIASGTTGAVRAFITRGKLSSVSKVKVGLFYTLMMEKPQSVRRDVQVSIPSSGLTFSITRK